MGEEAADPFRKRSDSKRLFHVGYFREGGYIREKLKEMEQKCNFCVYPCTKYVNVVLHFLL